MINERFLQLHRSVELGDSQTRFSSDLLAVGENVEDDPAAMPTVREHDQQCDGYALGCHGGA